MTDEILKWPTKPIPNPDRPKHSNLGGSGLRAEGATMTENFEKAKLPDGKLYCLGWYISYHPRDKEAILDGEFTSEELFKIAQHMRWIESFDGRYDPIVHGINAPELFE
jgi:hypothetical protein